MGYNNGFQNYKPIDGQPKNREKNTKPSITSFLKEAVQIEKDIKN